MCAASRIECWAAKSEADVRTVVATAALRTKATPFATLLATITA